MKIASKKVLNKYHRKIDSIEKMTQKIHNNVI
jgi:hypothetical protein